MHIRDFSFFNRRRCEASNGFHHPVNSWSASEWMVALIGEIGEAANNLKKINRIIEGRGAQNHKGETPGELLDNIKREIGDAYAYLDLFAQRLGLSLEDCAIEKWDEVSKRSGYPTRLRALEKAFEEGEIRDKGGLN